jgi:hypothetical protein
VYRQGYDLRGQQLNMALFDRTMTAGALRPDVRVEDISLVLEMVMAVRLGDHDRTQQLRHRYLTLLLDALHRPEGDDLPGPAPTWQELAERWTKT